MSLVDCIRQHIEREGPISFRDFMEAALYDPEEGYYSRGARIGEGGDFVTSPSLDPAFARAIARRFARDVGNFGGPVEFVDVGAGQGMLLSAFQEELARVAPLVAERTQLVAVERSPAARERLAELGIAVIDPGAFGDPSIGNRRRGPRRAPSKPKTARERGSSAIASGVSGWIFSNELFDAVPFFRVIGGEHGVEELAVGISASGFCWVRRPARRELLNYLARFGVVLRPGQQAEISLDAPGLYRLFAKALDCGRIVTFDYGHRTRTLYHPEARPRGTLAVHAGGRRGGDPLVRVGEVDLTAHVHWDALIAVGEETGLRTEGITRQWRFLVECGILKDMAAGRESRVASQGFGDPGPETRDLRLLRGAGALRAFRLINPEGMGDDFSVLVQSRGVPPLERIVEPPELAPCRT